jgi:hypothetical protein
MPQTVAAFMLDRLRQWGVTRIYGYPGDGINGLLGAFHEFEDDIDFVQAKELARALPGDPARGQVIRNALKGKIDELVHR